MLLFKQDMKNIPIHYNTTNTSFVKMHHILKKMGVENNTFFLALTQPELRDVDPFDKNLTDELKLKIAFECKINPWYFFREVVRVPVTGGSPIPYILHRANLAQIWSFFNNIDSYTVIGRQLGKTSSVNIIATYLMYVVGVKYSISYLANSERLRKNNIQFIRDTRDALPSYLIYKSGKDLDNSEFQYYYGVNGSMKNKYTTFLNKHTSGDAIAMGRGLQSSLMHLDEAEYFDYVADTFPAIMATMTTAAEQAKKAGLPTALMCTSTAGRLGDESCKYMLNLVNQSLVFNEAIYDSKDTIALENMLSLNATRKMFYITYSYKQLGKTDTWALEQKVITNSSDVEFERDYLNIRNAGLDASVISVDLLKKIKLSEKEPVSTVIKDGYIFKWYTHPDIVKNLNVPIIIGLDTSENLGNDFTSLVMLNGANMENLCTSRCNSSDLLKLASMLAKMMIENKNMILIPERKSTGGILISYICTELFNAGINPYTRIYSRIFQNRRIEPYASMDTFSQEAYEGTQKQYLGYPTAGKGEHSRSVLYDMTLMKSLEMNHDKIYDINLITELSSLTMKNGRIDHSSRSKDDMVIAYLLASWFIFYAENKNLYKAVNSYLTQISDSGAYIDPKYKKYQEDLLLIKASLEKELKKATNKLIISDLTRRLKDIEEKIDIDVVKIPVSIEAIKRPMNTTIDYDLLRVL